MQGVQSGMNFLLSDLLTIVIILGYSMNRLTSNLLSELFVGEDSKPLNAGSMTMMEYILHQTQQYLRIRR